jgi:cytochrome bd-type quinol oxidase subunit 2
MTDPYTIAFLVVPLVLAALGWAYELLAERAEPARSRGGVTAR